MVDMSTFDRVKKLCEEQKISVVQLEERLDFSRNSLYSWKRNKPSSEKLEKVADYFDVSTDYLLGRTDKKRYYDLTEEDEKDIQKELENMIESMNKNTAFAAADGSTIDELDEEDKELLLASLEQSLRIAKRIAKQKFTPKKYRN